MYFFIQSLPGYASRRLICTNFSSVSKERKSRKSGRRLTQRSPAPAHHTPRGSLQILKSHQVGALYFHDHGKTEQGLLTESTTVSVHDGVTGGTLCNTAHYNRISNYVSFIEARLSPQLSWVDTCCCDNQT